MIIRNWTIRGWKKETVEEEVGKRMINKTSLTGFLISLLLGASLYAQGQDRGGRGNDYGRMPTLAFRTDVPKHPYDIILGRPTDHSIELSALAYTELSGWVRYRSLNDKVEHESPHVVLKAGKPYSYVLDGLEPSTTYMYTFITENEAKVKTASEAYTFSTAKKPGAEFTFTVQADSHLDFGTDPDVYIKSLNLAAKSHPDFHIDLGDTFMTDKRNRYEDSFPQYLAQRYYLGLIGRTAPVFMVLGNHDGEENKRARNGTSGMMSWANSMRRTYFPNPIPNEFYSGNEVKLKQKEYREDYYAFTWGDALFIMLNPFSYGEGKGRSSDNWSRSLGIVQYRWLEATLKASHSKYKFVFLHNLVGGETPEGRGGAEASHFFEWGGCDLDGKDTFKEHRPGWGMPIHALLVKYGVSVVFHGHDHFYARQERDGIIYQLVPQPGHQKADNRGSPDEYGYKSGVIQGASGIIRISVSNDKCVVEYVRAYPAKSEGNGYKTGSTSEPYKLTLNGIDQYK
jgi:predicted phosphodiesterase